MFIACKTPSLLRHHFVTVSIRGYIVKNNEWKEEEVLYDRWEIKHFDSSQGKWVNNAKELGIASSTLNSIMAKATEIEGRSHVFDVFSNKQTHTQVGKYERLEDCILPVSYTHLNMNAWKTVSYSGSSRTGRKEF